MKRQHKFDHLLGTKHNFLTIRDFVFRSNDSGWVHKRVNLMKSNLSEDELTFWARAICKHPDLDLSEVSVYEREVKGANFWKKTGRAKRTPPNPE